MNETEEMRRERHQWAASRRYEIWRMQIAAKAGNSWSEYHPDHYRREIARMQGLLEEAGL
jgi:hypothetical protein